MNSLLTSTRNNLPMPLCHRIVLDTAFPGVAFAEPRATVHLNPSPTPLSTHNRNPLPLHLSIVRQPN